jgi:hypothetical protein
MKLMLICMLACAGISAAFVEGTTEPVQPGVESIVVCGVEYDLPDGIVYGQNYGTLDQSILADPNDPTSGTEAGYTGLVGDDAEMARWGEGPGSGSPGEWGTDVLVEGFSVVGTGQDFDIDQVNGDLYVCWDSNHSSGDTLYCYKSTDGGYTWTQVMIATNGDGAISNPKVVCVENGSGATQVVIGGIWIESGDDPIWTRRVAATGGSPVFEQAAANVSYFDMDGGIGSGSYAFITWVPASTYDIYAARNAVSGSGWVNSQSLFSNTQVTSYPEIAAGAGGTLGVAFIDDRITTNQEVRIKRSTDSGASWAGSAQVSNNSGAYDLRETDIAFTHEATQTGWICVTYDTGAGGDNFGYYYSTNSGSSWTYGTIFSAGSTDENLGSLGTRRITSTGAVTVAFNADPGDMTMFTWASASTPTTFTTPVQINDFSATGLWRPTAGWISNYSAIMYTNIGPYYIYLDAYNFTGNEDQTTGIIGADGSVQVSPNPVTGAASISFELAQAGTVNLAVYDIAGHVVSSVVDGQVMASGSHTETWDGSGFAPGVYFCRLTTAGVDETRMMVVTR